MKAWCLIALAVACGCTKKEEPRVAPVSSKDRIYCAAAVDSGACAKLPGEDATWCLETVAQLQARARDQRPWFGVPEAMGACSAHLPAEQCARYATAVESADAAGCAGLSKELGDCEAVASGDPAKCAGLGRNESSCRESVRDLEALRRGVTALAELPDGPRRAAAIGLLRGVSACEGL